MSTATKQALTPIELCREFWKREDARRKDLKTVPRKDALGRSLGLFADTPEVDEQREEYLLTLRENCPVVVVHCPLKEYLGATPSDDVGLSDHDPARGMGAIEFVKYHHDLVDHPTIEGAAMKNIHPTYGGRLKSEFPADILAVRRFLFSSGVEWSMAKTDDDVPVWRHKAGVRLRGALKASKRFPSGSLQPFAAWAVIAKASDLTADYRERRAASLPTVLEQFAAEIGVELIPDPNGPEGGEL